MNSCPVRALANANLLAHFVVFVQKFRIFGSQERSNLAIHSPKIEFIPSRIDANCGEANPRVGIGRTDLRGGLLLAGKSSCTGGGKSDSLGNEVLAQQPCLTLAQLGKRIVSLARARLPMAHEIDGAQMDFPILGYSMSESANSTNPFTRSPKF